MKQSHTPIGTWNFKFINKIARTLVVGSLVMIFSVMAAPAAKASTGLPISVGPRVKIVLAQSAYRPKEFAIRGPNGRVYIMHAADTYTSNAFAGYPTGKRLMFSPKDVVGQYWRNGIPAEESVFTTAGIYRFWFADNLETEWENSFAQCAWLYYAPGTSAGEEPRKINLHMVKEDQFLPCLYPDLETK